MLNDRKVSSEKAKKKLQATELLETVWWRNGEICSFQYLRLVATASG